MRTALCGLPRCAGGAFELVSCPHYLGEVVIYAGLALALAGQRLTAWLMLLWVVSPAEGQGLLGPSIRLCQLCPMAALTWVLAQGCLEMECAKAACGRRCWCAGLPGEAANSRMPDIRLLPPCQTLHRCPTCRWRPA